MSFFLRKKGKKRKKRRKIFPKKQKGDKRWIVWNRRKRSSAKKRLKKGFWATCEENVRTQVEEAKKQGINESKAERYFIKEAQKVAAGEKEDEFYLRVKNMLLSEGEVSDAIGRLTDKEYFSTLSYEERQRYTLSLSEKYLRALERFRRESEFALSSTENAR